MAKYMLLLHESRTAFQGLSPTEIQRIIQKYDDWRTGLEKEGRFLGGQKLFLSGRVLRRNGTSVDVTDGPFGEAKEVLGGYFLIEANSYDHAVDLARGGPHLDRGVVEIREVEFA
jgi:hypothetical protein